MPRLSVPARERLIVALDAATEEEARSLVDRLGDTVWFYKVNVVVMVTPWGMKFVTERLIRDRKLFIDLKMHDIGATIERAMQAIGGLTEKLPEGGGVRFVTLGPAAGATTYRAAIRGRGDRRFPEVLAIPLLSSLNEAEIAPAMSREDLHRLADRSAREALDGGCDGLIASGELIRRFRSAHPGAVIVSPGIRPPGAPTDDHKRFATPAEAIEMGADYLVVGRPIRTAKDPASVAGRILEEIEEALPRQCAGPSATDERRPSRPPVPGAGPSSGSGPSRTYRS